MTDSDKPSLKQKLSNILHRKKTTDDGETTSDATGASTTTRHVSDTTPGVPHGGATSAAHGGSAGHHATNGSGATRAADGAGFSDASDTVERQSISESFKPGQLEDTQPRRAAMDTVVTSAKKLPPGPEAQLTELEATYDKKPWQEAQRLTKAAELEASHASLAAGDAKKQLAAAQQAQAAVHDAGRKHDAAISEAEALKSSIHAPAQHTAAYKDAKQGHAQALADAERHNKSLAAAQAELEAKKRDLETNKPSIEQHHTKGSKLTEEYEEVIKKQEAVEGNKERLAALAAEADSVRGSHATDVERLTKELMRADDIAAEKERDFINAKEARRVLAVKLAEAKNKHNAAEGAFLQHKDAADNAAESVEGFVERSTYLRRQLDEYEEEHTRLINMEKDRQGEYDSAVAALEGLRSQGDPKKQAAYEAEEALKGKRAALEKAQGSARDAQARYRALIKEADSHATRGDKAARAAKSHVAEFDDLRKKAALHGDRHAQLWQAAQQHGTEGSDKATKAFQHLQSVVDKFTSS